MRPSIPKEPQLPQVLTTGPDIIALMGWLFDHTVGPKIEARHKRKQALKIVRQKEQEYEQRWAELKTPPAGPEKTKP